MRVRYSWEDPILDTGGGIKHAEPLLAGEAFVVVNGDSLLELRLAEVLDFHHAHGGVATLALRPDPDAARYGLVEIDGDDRIRRIAGRPEGASVPAGLRGYMFPGLHVLEPGIFRWMDGAPLFSITHHTYPRLLAAGIPIGGCVTNARWVNIDTPESLRAADHVLREAPFRYV